jgi:hypothetical protein
MMSFNVKDRKGTKSKGVGVRWIGERKEVTEA